MSDSGISISNISQTKEISGTKNIDEKINPWLDLGWVMLHIWIEDYGCPPMRLETTHVLLGWKADQGEPRIHKSKYGDY